MANMNVSYFVEHESHAEIRCADQCCEGCGEYPVLHIGGLTIYPTRQQLVKLADVIGAYLDEKGADAAAVAESAQAAYEQAEHDATIEVM